MVAEWWPSDVAEMLQRGAATRAERAEEVRRAGGGSQLPTVSMPAAELFGTWAVSNSGRGSGKGRKAEYGRGHQRLRPDGGGAVGSDEPQGADAGATAGRTGALPRVVRRFRAPGGERRRRPSQPPGSARRRARGGDEGGSTRARCAYPRGVLASAARCGGGG
eukprot:1723400-Pleurochrysis_carterae.AAC.1